MFCRFCGVPLNYPGQPYCLNCGRSLVVAPPKKERSGVAKFFIALAKCLGYFAVMQGVSGLFQIVYMVVLMFQFPNMGLSMNGYTDEYLAEMSKNLCWVMAASYVALFLVYMLIFAIRKKTLWNETGIRKTQFAALPSAFIFGVGLQIATVFIINVLCMLFPAVAESAAAPNESYELLLAESSVLSQFVFMAVATPVIEELVFRGLIYTRMKKGMPKIAAMLLSAVVFGIMHSGAVQFTYAAALGIIMVLIYEKYNSLLPCIFLHAGFNATNFIYDYLNMDSWLVCLALMALAAGCVLWFVVYFFISKPIYEEKTNETL